MLGAVVAVAVLVVLCGATEIDVQVGTGGDYTVLVNGEEWLVRFGG